MKIAENLIGKQFGELTVLGISHYKNYAAYMICKCSCGNETIVYYPNLIRGLTSSCGCLKKKFTKDSLYPNYTVLWNVWYAMKRRCYCKNESEFHNYGSRGITVCDEWKDNFQAFYEWAMNNGYKEGLTIDRIDNDGNYCPENCRLATAKQQALNKRNNRHVNFNGRIVTVKEAADILNLDYMKLYNVLYKNGFNFDNALERLKHQNKVRIRFGGSFWSLRELSEKTRIPYNRLRKIYYSHADKSYLERKLQDKEFVEAFGE